MINRVSSHLDFIKQPLFKLYLYDPAKKKRPTYYFSANGCLSCMAGGPMHRKTLTPPHG